MFLSLGLEASHILGRIKSHDEQQQAKWRKINIPVPHYHMHGIAIMHTHASTNLLEEKKISPQ